MAKGAKKKVRETFRDLVFQRDGHKCRVCKWNQDPTKLDAHHITDRNEMPAGGYVPENGVSLCPNCHVEAERWHQSGSALPGYTPEELYKAIGSTHAKAVEAAQKLEQRLMRSQ